MIDWAVMPLMGKEMGKEKQVGEEKELKHCMQDMLHVKYWWDILEKIRLTGTGAFRGSIRKQRQSKEIRG